jgi:hypothetical protein
MESKKCSICSVVKTPENTVVKYLKCKDCISEYKKQYKENNKEKVAETKKIWAENNKERILNRKRITMRVIKN